MGYPPQGTAGGITKLSELIIDTDKDWQAKEISNLKGIASGMTAGDVPFRGTAVLQRLAHSYGVGYNFLRAKDTGVKEIDWMDIQDLIIYLTGAVNRMIAPPVLSIPAPTLSLTVAEDHSGGGFTATPSLAVPTPSISLATLFNSPSAVGGAVADDGGVQTDETVAANNANPNDMTLLPAAPAVNDAYYFGLATPWDWLSLNIGQAGVGTWTIVWEYYNGAAYTALSNVLDTSNGFRNGGYQSVTFIKAGDWVVKDEGGIPNLYWVRARVSAYTAITTQPLGTQAWIGTH